MTSTKILNNKFKNKYVIERQIEEPMNAEVEFVQKFSDVLHQVEKEQHLNELENQKLLFLTSEFDYPGKRKILSENVVDERIMMKVDRDTYDPWKEWMERNSTTTKNQRNEKSGRVNKNPRLTKRLTGNVSTSQNMMGLGGKPAYGGPHQRISRSRIDKSNNDQFSTVLKHHQPERKYSRKSKYDITAGGNSDDEDFIDDGDESESDSDRIRRQIRNNQKQIHQHPHYHSNYGMENMDHVGRSIGRHSYNYNDSISRHSYQTSIEPPIKSYVSRRHHKVSGSIPIINPLLHQPSYQVPEQRYSHQPATNHRRRDKPLKYMFDNVKD
ncbi:hypothetical protein SNEBB_007164 [Seison nebaliae]|nr:hypothetical protein SNEBB_007164 [Seison nebaliae]